MIKPTYLVAVITCLTATSALSAEDPADSEMRFHNLDQNKDGHISLYEARDKHRVFYFYQKADTDEDGHLNKTEFSAFEIEVPAYKEK